MRRLKQFLLLTIGLLLIKSAAGAGAASPQPTVPAPADGSLISHLAFDAEVKEYQAKPLERSAPFAFNLTNTSGTELTVDRVQTSCGCTVASLPENPWHIAPGGHGQVDVTMDLVGKPVGTVAKTITFYLSANGVNAGTRIVTVKARIPPDPVENISALSAADRAAAMEKAKADPQRIFTEAKCAECHVNPGLHATGAALYAADCGICHDSPNRASSVPDLHKLKAPPGAEYWKRIIYNGKPNTMMPAFSTRHGGPLTNEQVGSLVSYLSRAFAPEAAMRGGR